jgi:hypothetical protein
MRRNNLVHLAHITEANSANSMQKGCSLHIQIMQLTCLIDATNKKNAPANRGILASAEADQNFLS